MLCIYKRKKLTELTINFFTNHLVIPPRFELGINEPESLVLPLHYRTI